MLYLIRHAAVHSYYQSRTLGPLDIPLSDELDVLLDMNHRAELLKPLLPVHDDILVISSPLSRAMDTADLLSYSLTETDDRLSEFDMGILSDRPKVEVMEQVMNTELHPDSNKHKGESFADFRARVEQALHHYLMIAQNRDVVIITHSGVMRLICTRLLRIKSKNWIPDYLEMIEIDPVAVEDYLQSSSTILDHLLTGLLQKQPMMDTD